MFGLPLATIITLMPIIGILFIALIEKKNVLGIKSVSLWTTAFTFCFSLIVSGAFDYESKIITEEVAIFSKSLVEYRVGIDAFSAMFVPIICLICFICILWITKHKTKKLFLISILLFETLAIGAFYAWNLFLLFIFIEASIIPMYVMMSQQKEKSIDAILHFMLYAMISAMLVLIAFILIYLETQTTNIKEIQEIGVKNATVFWLLVIGIGIKMPIFPFYSWLPIAHVKSRTVCSVLLASIVLKFSSLLIVRFIQPLFTGVLQENIHLVIFIIIISIAFATAQLLFQKDIKSIFAHFSIIHLNTAFLIMLCEIKSNGFTFAVIGHSLLMPILFFASHVIENVYNTRLIPQIKSMTNNVPKNVKIITFIAFCCLISAPFTWGFVTEILTFQSIVKVSPFYAFFLGTLMLTAVTYVIHIYNSNFAFWKPSENEIYILDMHKKFALFLLFCAILFGGMFPKVLLL